MYKLVGEEKFLLWVVCSIQLQVFCGNGGEKLLVLSEGLLKKHVASHSLHEPEALMVYISILEQQAKYGDALELLSGKLGSLLNTEVDNLTIKGRLLARLGDYAAASNIFQRMLELCPDEWDCFLKYLSCLLEDESIWCGMEKNDQIHPPRCLPWKISPLSDDVFDSRMSDASAFVQKLMEDTDNDFVRGPYLANIEIEKRKQLHGKEHDLKMMEALTKYYVRFGHLVSFISDIEMFLDVLTSETSEVKVTFIEMLKKCSDCLSTVPTKVLGHSISLFKIQELIQYKFQFPVAEVEDSAVQMVDMYGKNLPLSKDLDPQENMHGEELLSMACNALVQLFWNTGNFGYFIEAIMVLEFGLTIHRQVSQYKILLLHLYSHLGMLLLAHERFKSLDIKNILMETLSHHILPQMLVSPLWMELNNLLQDYLKFMDGHLRESADFTFLAYHHRNYSKVIEFVQFKEQLRRSSQYLMAKVEAPILKLKQNADNIENEEAVLGSLKFGADFLELSNEIGSKCLTFNEDFHSRPWWTPSSERNYLLGPFDGISYCPREDLVKEREANVRRAIERKSLLPRMIYLSIQSASTLVKDNFEVNGSVSDCKVLSELKILLERYAMSLGFSFSDAIGVVMEISSGKKPLEVFGSDLIDWLNFAVFWDSWSSSSHELAREDQPQPSIVVGSLLEKCISEKISSTEPTIFSPLHDISIFVQLISEPLAWHGLVIQSHIRSLLPSGKRKKKTGHADASALSHIRDSVHNFGAIVEKVMNWAKQQINVSEDENLELVLSSVRKKGENGPGQVFQILETMPTYINETEVGDHISQALKSWNPVDVARKIVAGKCTVLMQFLQICESKFKLFQALNRKITQV